MKCNTKLIINIMVITDKITRCALCEDVPPHCSHLHLQSRNTMCQDSPNIAPENINNHGSIQWGKI